VKKRSEEEYFDFIAGLRDGCVLLMGIIGISLMVTLGGCGNTISGLGQDIKDVGTKVSDWQNKKPIEKKASK
jgi:predicted small secreted protein